MESLCGPTPWPAPEPVEGYLMIFSWGGEVSGEGKGGGGGTVVADLVLLVFVEELVKGVGGEVEGFRR